MRNQSGMACEGILESNRRSFPPGHLKHFIQGYLKSLIQTQRLAGSCSDDVQRFLFLGSPLRLLEELPVFHRYSHLARNRHEVSALLRAEVPDLAAAKMDDST